ncbi:MAG TPA: histidine--tRNA ligase [Nitrospirae bacterium]|nr:histidine--tRNA ligase [bacterium BMS3Bbin09]HDH34078.1 histidine--tRNA ligase [Nitrospirota bacterium]HDN95431.1 histidine--tRNA ligase [Nitrospirota bacterium]HDO67580.1 histidine--tRNA ligase [Nitrospirota bacterium]HDZ84735.1 histidine--tRNA ligase [Nitrospirota bacterium]
MKYRKLKGVQDILPPDISVWQFIEEKAGNIFRSYGYREIRLPIMESTDVFTRSIGETSDIVEKEMYTFQDKGNRSITLRPEGTAPFVRAYVENHLYNEPAPQKYYYMGPMFRYERPQANRYRQFYQIGAEAMGIDDPKLDAEIISMLSSILEAIGLKELNFEITSIGCKECRPDYIKALKDFLEDKLIDLCSDCGRRFKTNPLRVLDCKVPGCVKARKGSPPMVDYLCKDCGDHFEQLNNNLKKLNVQHTINPSLVRGLDYYTKTAFEVSSENLGSQSAVAAGGRYDGMVKEFGGPATPGIGFAIGMERIIPLINDSLKTTDGPELLICPLGEEAAEESLIIAEQLRAKGHWVEVNYDNTSIRSQLRKANRIGAKNVIVLGDDELENRKVALKNMTDKTEQIVALASDELLKILKTD